MNFKILRVPHQCDDFPIEDLPEGTVIKCMTCGAKYRRTPSHWQRWGWRWRLRVQSSDMSSYSSRSRPYPNEPRQDPDFYA